MKINRTALRGPALPSKKYSNVPGDTRRVLTRSCGRIPKGAVYQPLSGGGDPYAVEITVLSPSPSRRVRVQLRCAACSLPHAEGECDETERRRNTELAEGIYDDGYGDLEGTAPRTPEEM